MRHSRARRLLYEYLSNELSAADRVSVEQHCASCERCASQLETMRENLRVFSRPQISAADVQPEEFWNAFVRKVEASTAARPRSTRNPWTGLLDEIERTIQLQWRTIAGFASALTLLAVVFAVWKLSPPAPPPDHAGEMTVSPDNTILANTRVNQYFRKSKNLFVGLTNMKTFEGQPIDLTAERHASRELIQEARYLKQQPLDTRSSELIEQLERILIELANMEQQTDLPDVEMIRSGIHQKNLLFKIRMAQALYDPSKNKQPSTTYERTAR